MLSDLKLFIRNSKINAVTFGRRLERKNRNQKAEQTDDSIISSRSEKNDVKKEQSRLFLLRWR